MICIIIVRCIQIHYNNCGGWEGGFSLSFPVSLGGEGGGTVDGGGGVGFHNQVT